MGYKYIMAVRKVRGTLAHTLLLSLYMPLFRPLLGAHDALDKYEYIDGQRRTKYDFHHAIQPLYRLQWVVVHLGTTNFNQERTKKSTVLLLEGGEDD